MISTGRRKKNFLPDIPKTYFIWTDDTTKEFPKNVVKIHQPQLPWPDPTLKRYHFFDRAKSDLKKFDYLFFMNANLIVDQPVGREVIPTAEQRLMMTKHPGYTKTPPKGLPYDRSHSKAGVLENEGHIYVTGGFNGGEAKAFLAMARIIKRRVDQDEKKKVIARWHDESHLNRFLIDIEKRGVKPLISDARYLMPEEALKNGSYQNLTAEKHDKKLFMNDDNQLFQIFGATAEKSSKNPYLYSHLTKEQQKKISDQLLPAERFDEKLFSDSKYIGLSGYGQNPHFFEHVSRKIQKEFQFKEPLSPKNKKLADQMKRENSICVHVRRGDYLRWGYPILTLPYYEKAVDYILSKDSDTPRLYVFSNDTDWVKRFFKTSWSQTIIEGNSDIQDLQLMTNCRHNVIANSSYSWWGAYLNPNPDKIVVMPDKWDYWHDWWAKEIRPETWHMMSAQDVIPYKIAVVTFLTEKTHSLFDAFQKNMDEQFFIYTPKTYYVFRNKNTLLLPENVKAYTRPDISHSMLSVISKSDQLKKELEHYDFIVMSSVEMRLLNRVLSDIFPAPRQQASFLPDPKDQGKVPSEFCILTGSAFRQIMNFVSMAITANQEAGLLSHLSDTAYLTAWKKQETTFRRDFLMLPQTLVKRVP